MIWESSGNHDGDEDGVYAQHYHPNLTVFKAEFVVNDITGDD